MRRLELRWYLDEQSGLAHCYVKHGVTEREVEEVLERPAEDRVSRDESRTAIGATISGRILKIVYVLDPDGKGAFVVTAFDVKGKALQAFRRRMRKR